MATYRVKETVLEVHGKPFNLFAIIHWTARFASVGPTFCGDPATSIGWFVQFRTLNIAHPVCEA